MAQSGHFPYGENWYESGGSNKLKFTHSTRSLRALRSGQASYERDAESGNDYAIFRTHISRLGRFNRPDPIAGSRAGSLAAPPVGHALASFLSLTLFLRVDTAHPAC